MATTIPSRRRARLAAVALSALAIPPLVAAACGGGDDAPVLDAEAARGKQRARELNCTSCHTADGLRSEGPTWKGLYGSSVPLRDGRTVTADDAYLTTAIEEPTREVHAGFTPMQPVKELQDADVAPIVAYIKALSSR